MSTRSALTLILALLCNHAYCSDSYYLCGSDEDGCWDYRSCACIPAQNIDTPFCLDLDTLSCSPLAQKPDCYPLFIHKNQSECLATLFQSEPTPPCTLVSETFCIEHHILICDAEGHYYDSGKLN